MAPKSMPDRCLGASSTKSRKQCFYARKVHPWSFYCSSRSCHDKGYTLTVEQDGKKLCIECLYSHEKHIGWSCTQKGDCLEATRNVADRYKMTFEHEDLEEEDAMLTAENNSGGATSSSSSSGNQQLLKERVDDLFEKASTEVQKIRELQHSVHVLQEHMKELEDQIKYMSKHTYFKREWVDYYNAATDDE